MDVHIKLLIKGQVSEWGGPRGLIIVLSDYNSSDATGVNTIEVNLSLKDLNESLITWMLWYYVTHFVTIWITVM